MHQQQILKGALEITSSHKTLYIGFKFNNWTYRLYLTVAELKLSL